MNGACIMSKSPDVNITVLPGNWRTECIAETEAVLRYAASHINDRLTFPFNEEIKIERGSPITLLRNKRRQRGSGPITIRLDVEGCWWNQFTYQFAHEFSHAISNYEEYYWIPNSWFCEAIGELASSFALRQMEYNGWCDLPLPKDCLLYFKEYESKCRAMRNEELREHYGDKINVYDWILSQEAEMRKAAIRLINGKRYTQKERAMFAVVAYTLLPVFEEHPKGWNTIRNFPVSNVGI